MTDTSSPTPSGHLAFLRRRPFWAAICGIILIYCFGVLSLYLFGGNFYWHSIVTEVHVSFGALLWGMIGWKVGGSYLGCLLVAVYYLVFILLLRKTFLKPNVQIRYPIIFVVLVILGHYFNMLYLNGL